MIASGVYFGRNIRFFTLALGLVVPFAALAQGRIDPSLPSAPLSFHRKFLMTPGIDTVKDPHAVLPPLTTKEKYRLFWLRTADISVPVEAAFFAGFSQVMRNSPRYGTDSGAYAARFGSYAANTVSCNFFEDALLPSVFKQDPRYFRKGTGSVKSRLLYALKEEWVTRSDSGGSAFNYSEVLGAGFSTALGDAWYPRQRVRSGGLTLNGTMERYAAKLAFTAVRNVAHEFGRFHENNSVVVNAVATP
ncbi:MAG TPA: hypothetical protein VHZ07_04775 [Bryobacteraceae bacterium]|jgi:hypothetical protein|nr:hypothetical protein [Bryobacteraceae bacterium]